jgi:hypothetical protein
VSAEIVSTGRMQWRRAMTRLPLLLIAVFGLPASVAAQGTPPSPDPDRIMQRHSVVLDCVREIRRDDEGASQFSAYITLRGEVRTFGGDADDEGQFRKCLTRRGLSLQARTPKAE